MSAAARKGIAPTKAWPLTPLLSFQKCHLLPTFSAGREAPVAIWSTYTGGAPTAKIRSDREPHSPRMSPNGCPSKTNPVAADAPKIASA